MTGRGDVEPDVPTAASNEQWIERILASHPDVVTALDDAHRAAWSAADQRLLELCRIRVAQLVGGPVETGVPGGDGVVGDDVRDAVVNWPSAPQFDDRDRAVLAWCEMFVIDVASLDDATSAAVREHLGDSGLLDLTNALLVIEQRQRLRCIWERLFGSDRTPS